MACDFLYKGQTFTKQQLEQYLKDNPQEVSEILTSLQSKEGIQYSFKAISNITKNLSKVNNWFKQMKDTDVFWNKVQQDLQIPKDQISLLRNSEGNTIEEKLISFTANYSFAVEINTAKKNTHVEEGFENLDNTDTPTTYYSNLTVPGGTNYTEQEISTPLITPSIKGHAQFATDNGIGWFRSDDKTIDSTLEDYEVEYEGWGGTNSYIQKHEGSSGGTLTKTRRILEVQSDLFQKGRDRKDLVNKEISLAKDGSEGYYDLDGFRYGREKDIYTKGIVGKDNTWISITKEEYYSKLKPENEFLQLLNKNNNWVTFFVKSIIQDSAKKGYEKVLFPSGNTASKIEGHATLEEFKKQKEDRIKFLQEEKAKGKTTSANESVINSFGIESELDIDREINQLKQELERVETEGFGALKPIFNFYENTVANILKKQGYNPVEITDEYGNTWNEIILNKNVEDIISFQPSLTKEQLQEREDYNSILQDLGLSQEEVNQVQQIFEETQDLYDSLNFQSNVDFDNINTNLIKLKENLESKYEKWKLSNRHNFGTSEYKAKNLEFYTTIKDFESKIQTIKTDERQAVYDYLKAEYKELKEALENYKDGAVSNESLMERIDFLHSYITGKNLKGEQTDVWDFSDFPDFEKELHKPVSDLSLLYEDFNNNRVFELIKTLPSFVFYKKENNFTEEQFKEVFINAANEKLKDINAAQQYALGLNSNDDSIFATALFDMYHRDIEIAKNPMRGVGRRMAELNEELKKEGFNFDSLKEKNERGVDTRLLVNLYTSKFSKNELPKYYNLLKEYRAKKDHKSQEKSIAYKNTISWLKLHTDVIDYSKLSAVRDLYGGHEKLGKYFTHSQQEIDSYEAELKKKLGKEFDKIVTSSVQKIENFLERDAHEFLNNKNFYNVFYYENNPFEFVNNYNTNPFSPIQIGQNFYRYNMSSHIEYIPKQNTVDVNTGELKSTGYYNENFQKDIMNNPKAYELWELMVDSYRNFINSTYIESGQNIDSLSWGKLNSDLAEVILNNYKSPQGIAKIGKALIDTWKDSWYFTNQSGDPKKLKDNYYDTSEYEVSVYTNALMNKGLSNLITTAKEKGIPTKTEKEITDGLSEQEADKAINKYKAQLANDIASKTYADSKSGDIVKITLALMELSAIQRARIEGQMAAELLVDKHVNMLDKHGIKGGRRKSNDKIQNWKAVNIYNTDEGADNVEVKTFGKRLSDFERNLKKILESMLSEFKNGQDVSFKINGMTYKRVKGVYQVFDEKNTMKNIPEEDFYKELENYVNQTIESLGTPMTLNSVVNGFISNMTKKAFIINPISGFNNRYEGKFTNMTNDLTGQYWTPGNNDYSEQFLTFANILKIAPKKLSTLHKNKYLQLQTLQQLIEEMNILQDRKNEIEKKEKESNFGKVRKFFNWFALAIDNPEFKNQSTIILNMLQDVKVKDNDGKEHPFFDKKTLSFTIYKPGTLELKPEFSQHNKGFSDFFYNVDNVESNQFYIVKERISDAISQIQGNYSNTDSIAMRHMKGWGGIAWGKVLSTFMRWFPSHANQRFGVRNVNYLQNKKGQKGRYRVLWDNPYVGTTYASSILALTLGPGSLIFALPVVAGLTKVVYNKFVLKKAIHSQAVQVRTLAGFLQETLMRSLGLPLKLLKVGPNSKIKNNKLNNMLTNSDKMMKGLSEQEKGAVKAMAQELAIQLNILFIMLLLKAALHGGSGDDDEEKMLHNFIDNQGNRLINNLAVWINPYQLVTENTQFALLRSVKNVLKTTSDLYKLSIGDKIDEKRPIMNIIKEQPFLPIPNVVTKAVVKGEYPGADAKEYQNSQWFDRYTKTQEWKDEQKYKKKRASYKEAYADYLRESISNDRPNLSEEEVEEIVDRQVRSRMNKKNMRRKSGETYKDALDRINLDDTEFEDGK